MVEVVGDPVVAAAILDRRLHHCHVVTIRGDNCRLREKRRAVIPADALSCTDEDLVRSFCEVFGSTARGMECLPSVEMPPEFEGRIYATDCEGMCLIIDDYERIVRFALHSSLAVNFSTEAPGGAERRLLGRFLGEAMLSAVLLTAHVETYG